MGDRCGVCKIWVGRSEGKSHLEGIEVGGMIILKWIFNKCGGDTDWIELAEDRDGWWALVNAVMNLRVP